jgi:hypothetical protein
VAGRRCIAACQPVNRRIAHGIRGAQVAVPGEQRRQGGRSCVVVRHAGNLALANGNARVRLTFRNPATYRTRQ